MFKVHHLNQSRSTRVLWLLEELHIPYEVEHHQRDAQTQLAPASLGKVHPLSKAPVIEHNGLTLCESGAIIEYILDQDELSRLRPEKSSTEYYKYLEWLHFAEGSLALPVIIHLLMQMEERNGSQAMDNYISKELNLDFSYIDNTLSQQTYFAGAQFTAADIMMTIILEIAERLGLTKNRPHIERFLTRMKEREAYKKARSLG